ncbi:TetR/AcrR family transcriptional regulator [Nocardia huaxiensis]|uniref:TetR/AcrR family transcriptional regulator n=1 Tax=Nocardia huaxiensis TaxID=2755382 RepID=A0A7D6VF60_9NOCA|nr:TetR/AcrR family transcriptional regulator [Nocardia huaxiensis]QLY28130.1 TetR/AcrR family transcriptional regulator [Nocardia huaxiensis]UFS98423.1 TetR/AcrR family transcriptional regulator [Nocardia huaxiensis]
MAASQTWGGSSAQARRSARRARLIDAAIDVWSEAGWGAVSLRSVCARAGLNDRYFRESFTDRDALLAAAWDQVREETTTALAAILANLAAEPPLAVLQQAIEQMVVNVADDPRRAPVLFGDHAGCAILERRRHQLILGATEVLAAGMEPHLREDRNLEQFRGSVLMAVGGFVELTTAWRVGAVEIDAAGIIAQTTHFGSVLADYYLTPGR